MNLIIRYNFIMDYNRTILLIIRNRKKIVQISLISWILNKVIIVRNLKSKEKILHLKVNHQKIFLLVQTNFKFLKNFSLIISHINWALHVQILNKSRKIIRLIQMMKLLLIVLIHHNNHKINLKVHIWIKINLYCKSIIRIFRILIILM